MPFSARWRTPSNRLRDVCVISIVAVLGLVMAHWAYARLTPLDWASVTGATVAPALAGPTSGASAASSAASAVKPNAPVSAASVAVVPKVIAPTDTQKAQVSQAQQTSNASAR